MRPPRYGRVVADGGWAAEPASQPGRPRRRAHLLPAALRAVAGRRSLCGANAYRGFCQILSGAPPPPIEALVSITIRLLDANGVDTQPGCPACALGPVSCENGRALTQKPPASCVSSRAASEPLASSRGVCSAQIGTLLFLGCCWHEEKEIVPKSYLTAKS